MGPVIKCLLNPKCLDLKASALTTGTHCLLLRYDALSLFLRGRNQCIFCLKAYLNCLGPVPERCNNSIPGTNAPYSGIFIPGIELLHLSGTRPWSILVYHVKSRCIYISHSKSALRKPSFSLLYIVLKLALTESSYVDFFPWLALHGPAIMELCNNYLEGWRGSVMSKLSLLSEVKPPFTRCKITFNPSSF